MWAVCTFSKKQDQQDHMAFVRIFKTTPRILQQPTGIEVSNPGLLSLRSSYITHHTICIPIYKISNAERQIAHYLTETRCRGLTGSDAEYLGQETQDSRQQQARTRTSGIIECNSRLSQSLKDMHQLYMGRGNLHNIGEGRVTGSLTAS